MNFTFPLHRVLRHPISLITHSTLPSNLTLREQLHEIIDEMGILSFKAQNLKAAITSFNKFRHQDTNIYISRDDSCVLGYIKVGYKRLFLIDEKARQHELDVLCLLDIYVHDTVQRMGIGKKLFDFMLQCQDSQARFLAYDRPSDKLLSFLEKHYRLTFGIQQPNRFVIFADMMLGRMIFGKDGKAFRLKKKVRSEEELVDVEFVKVESLVKETPISPLKTPAKKSNTPQSRRTSYHKYTSSGIKHQLEQLEEKQNSLPLVASIDLRPGSRTTPLPPIEAEEENMRKEEEERATETFTPLPIVPPWEKPSEEMQTNSLRKKYKRFAKSLVLK